MFTQHNNVYLMAAARQNFNAASLLLFLHRVVDVFKHYFEELEEESLRDNFVVVDGSYAEASNGFKLVCFSSVWLRLFISHARAFTAKSYIFPEGKASDLVEKHSRSRIEIMVKPEANLRSAGSAFSSITSHLIGMIKDRFGNGSILNSTATNVEIEMPVPPDATNPNIRTSMGSASYAPEKDAMVWKIKSFPGGKEYMCRAELKLPSVTDEDSDPERKAPIRVKFEIPYFTVSGIQVRYLKIIEKSGCQALPWVRYITMAGSTNSQAHLKSQTLCSLVANGANRAGEYGVFSIRF
uniref:MHD domain-containing protein n=1 Tax=Kalanchoe fedtschenkoi TaxID=63787 RepID=A0A7N0T586_KALFE